MTLSREGMTWLCLLSSVDARTGENGAMSMELGGQSLDHWRGVIWDPVSVGQQSIFVCYDCLCLIVLFRAMWLLVSTSFILAMEGPFLPIFRIFSHPDRDHRKHGILFLINIKFPNIP